MEQIVKAQAAHVHRMRTEPGYMAFYQQQAMQQAQGQQLPAQHAASQAQYWYQRNTMPGTAMGNAHHPGMQANTLQQMGMNVKQVGQQQGAPR